MRPAVPRGTFPPYPTTADAMAYAEDYRINHFCHSSDPKDFAIFNHNRYIDITATGGLNDYFVVYAYPPGGFWYAYLIELKQIEPWRGWILQYLARQQTYQIIIQTTHDGHERFLEVKKQLGL